MSAQGPPTKEQLDQRAQDAAKLWSSKNIDGIMEKYHDDLKYTDLGLGCDGISKSALKDLLTRLFDSIDDFKMEPVSLNVSMVGTTVTIASEFRSSGKYVKDVPELGVKATGQKISALGASISTMDAASQTVIKIHHYSRYYFGDDKVPALA